MTVKINTHNFPILFFGSFVALALTHSAYADAVSKVINANEKYTCDASELDAYIGQVAKPLFVPIPVTSVDEHIRNQMAKKQVEGEGEESCLNLAMDNTLFEKINDLIDKIKNLDIAVPPNILDGLMKALKKKMDELYTGICNATTKEFARKKIEEFIEDKYDVDVDKLKGLNKKENRKAMLEEIGEDVLSDKMAEKGVDNRWSNQDDDGWTSVSEDLAKDKTNKVADKIFKKED